MERVIADTGFVVALANRLDQRHAEVTPIYLQYQQIFLPQVALVEIAYLIGRDAGITTVVQFLHGLSASRFELRNEKSINGLMSELRYGSIVPFG